MDPRAEFDRLSPFIQANISRKFAGWKSMRDRFLNQFGGAGDSATGIANANSYYAQLVEARFPGDEFARPSGRLTPVHPRMRGKFERCVALLRTKNAAANALGRLTSVGGFIIRENANNANELSLHSFGWALDLDPELNPNIPRKAIPALLIQMLTKVDIYGEHSERLRKPGSFDELLPHVQAMANASREFSAVFTSPESLRTSLQRVLREHFEATASQRDMADLESLVKSPVDSKLKVIAKLTSLGVAHSMIADAESMLRSSFALLKSRQGETRPRVQGTAASIAAFGFINMPPELIAGLIASDGGGLTWLGATRGTKDFMHFELNPADRPALHA
jgi:hypothetical protein